MVFLKQMTVSLVISKILSNNSIHTKMKIFSYLFTRKTIKRCNIINEKDQCSVNFFFYVEIPFIADTVVLSTSSEKEKKHLFI